MVARRAAGEGNLRLRKDGRWEGRPGSPSRRSPQAAVCLGRTQAEARTKLQEAYPANARSSSAVGSAHGRRLPRPVAGRRSCRSCVPRLSGATRHRALHLKPGLGRYATRTPQPAARPGFLNAKASGPLATLGVQRSGPVLRQGADTRGAMGTGGRNVAKLASRHASRVDEIRPLTQEQARSFLDAIRGDRLEALYLVAIGTGLGRARSSASLVGCRPRASERSGFGRRSNEIAGPRPVEPKSSTSRRVVAMPAFVRDCAVAHIGLARCRNDCWRDTLASDDLASLVFTTTVGTPMDGTAVTKRFQAVLGGAGLPRQRFHDLRQPAPRSSSPQGVAPRVVMEQLGHSQISLTMNTYSHVIPELGGLPRSGWTSCSASRRYPIP